MESYTALKKDRLLIHTTTWIDFQECYPEGEKKPVSNGYIVCDFILSKIIK